MARGSVESSRADAARGARKGTPGAALNAGRAIAVRRGVELLAPAYGHGEAESSASRGSGVSVLFPNVPAPQEFFARTK